MGLFGGGNSTTATYFDPSAVAPGSIYSGQAPSVPVTVSTAGANSPVTPTVNNVPTSNQGYNTAPAIGNTNIGGDLAIFTTDPGTIQSALDFANGIISGSVGTMAKLSDNINKASFDFATGAGASAFKLVDNANANATRTSQAAFDFASGAGGSAYKYAGESAAAAYNFAAGAGASAFKLVNENDIRYFNALGELQSGVLGSKTEDLKFAAGLTQGYAQIYQALANQSSATSAQALSTVTDLSQGVINGLATELHNSVTRVGQDQLNALNFFGTQTAQLQNATTKAIDTVALRTSSEQAQGLDSLQQTFVKIAIGLGVVVVVVAFIAKGRA